MSAKRRNKKKMPSTLASIKMKANQITNPFGRDFKIFRNCFVEYADNIFRNKHVLEELYILFEKLGDSDIYANRCQKWPEDEHSVTLLPEHFYTYRTILEKLNFFIATYWKYIMKLRNLFESLESKSKSVRFPKLPLLPAKGKKGKANLPRKSLRIQKLSETEQHVKILQQEQMEPKMKSKSVYKCKVLIEVPPEIFLNKKKFTIKYD